MSRLLHRWIALPATALVLVLMLSGAALSLFPALESAQNPPTPPGMSVAELASRVKASLPEVQQVKRAPSGRITAYYFAGLTPAARVIDPATGEVLGDAAASATQNWLVELHRALLLGSAGRIAAGIGAGLMLLLSVSGVALLARRMGGWRRLLAPARGTLAQRLHVDLGRLALAGLLLSATTGLWMTLTVFGVISAAEPMPAFPAEVSGEVAPDPGQLAALRDIPLARLRVLSFPYPGDATDVFTVETDRGTGYVDQGSGAMLSFEPLGPIGHADTLIYALHTGRGMWLVGLLLGLSSLGGAVLSVTGLAIWLRGRRASARLRGFDGPGRADTILLVGSEGGSSWGFAETLGRALKEAGQRVHVAPLSAFEPGRWKRAERLIVLSATYGDGDAPGSARGFEARLARHGAGARPLPVAVLGFGDSRYARFCGFAETVQRAFDDLGWPRLCDLGRIDRQSPQEFARWGRELGRSLGLDLALNHQPDLPKTQELTLVARRDYGHDLQEPTAILRFSLPRTGPWQRLTGRGWPRFSAGDLLGILPEGDRLARFYSLASSSRDGFVEICVKKHPGGLCSGQLHALKPGDSVQAFIRPNPAFRPARGRPVVLIGAGTGIGPLAGFIRANRRRSPMHLYFGTRHPEADLLYDDALEQWRGSGRLASLAVAFSRIGERLHVQDLLRRDGERLAQMAAEGAQFLVCGGRAMAEGVQAALAEALRPAGLSLETLKAEGRYVEDVY